MSHISQFFNVAILQISKDIDLLLIGKTGKGKSALRNSLLARKAFVSTADFSSVTDVIKAEQGSFNGRVLKVVNTPGVCDMRMSEEDSVKMVTEKMNDAIEINPDGYHAFIYVLKFGERFTEEDVNVLLILKNIFGSEFVNKFCILVLTCGDNFEKQVTNETGETFKQWCDKQQGVFKQLLDECEGRVVLFDNFTKENEEIQKQKTDLIHVIDRMQSSGKRYTDTYFVQAKETRDKLLIECKIPALKDKILKEMGIIMSSYNQMNFEDLESKRKSLLDLNEKTKVLLHDISKEDKESGALSTILKTVKKTNKMVENEIRVCEILIHEHNKYKEMRESLLLEIDTCKTKIDILDKSEKRNDKKITIEIDELKAKLEQAKATIKKEEESNKKKVSEMTDNFDKKIAVYKNLEQFYKEQTEKFEEKVAHLEQQLRRQSNQLCESINKFKMPDNVDRYTHKETWELHLKELNLRAENEKQEYETRMSVLESNAVEQKLKLEKRIAELKSNAKEEKELYQRNQAYCESRAKEQKENYEQTLTDIETKVKDQKYIFEHKIAVLESKAKDQVEINEQKIADLKSKAKFQKKINERKLADLESKAKDHIEIYERKIADLELKAKFQKEINEQTIADLNLLAKDQKETFELKHSYLISIANEQKESYEQKITDFEKKIKELIASHGQKLKDLALLEDEKQHIYKCNLDRKNKYIDDLENRLVQHIVRRTMYMFDREH
ncbi:uncharacterized protein LOC131943691 [Physella acuta]|uniref:uncharacterized protein LOC131943691 n=1 Tax=Physella acuta TaxID=109671 RepID=UPI0027DAE4F9|nr:uncharacterized protein LOC131943691 [Physella acuta]